MATQSAETLVDNEWRLLGNGPVVAIATQTTSGFYAKISATQPPATDAERESAFYGRAGQPVTYVGLAASDQVWGISHGGDLTVSVAKS
ncbi:hypothetical protein [Roseibium album]|uniref:hypothetical protein n=1 Tax=Roseibium album TaxID=311410 RepID=UPI0024931A37|nr:hypothetical protein [Roseibium album]